MEYFTISELIKSDTAIKHRIWNGASREVENNLIALVAAVLDPLRKMYGKPIHVTSGYRNEIVNKAVGGVKNSQHLKGEAADIDTGSKSQNQHLARILANSGLPFDQLIDENDYSWIHVSYTKNGSCRRQILRYKNKVYKQISINEL